MNSLETDLRYYDVNLFEFLSSRSWLTCAGVDDLPGVFGLLACVHTMIAKSVRPCEQPVVEDNVLIKGDITFGRNVRIMRGATLKGNLWIGDNVTIGSNAIVRGTTYIGNNVSIDSFSDIKDSIIFDGASIGPVCFAGDSIIGERAFLGAVVRTSNVRLDGDLVSVRLRSGETVRSGSKSLGAFVGSQACVGIGTVILPGRVIGRQSLISPGVLISRNVEPGARVVLAQSLSITTNFREPDDE